MDVVTDQYSLYHGNCLEILKLLPDGCADAVVTSPPYYNAREYSQFSTYEDYLCFIKQFLLSTRTVLRPSGILALNVSCVIEPRVSRSHESSRLPIPFDCVTIARDAGLKFIDDIIWQRPDGASSRAIKFSHHRRPVAYKPFQVTEYILIFKNGDGLLDRVIRDHDDVTIAASRIDDGYERTNIWRISPERVKGHPAPYPIGLAERLISYYSFIGDTIVDPFMGSATTGVAALNLGRKFIGMEIHKQYFDIAVRRISAA